MCFSAGASFTSGVVLSIAGIASVRNAKSIKQSLFASIPLIFAIQQISEGFIWLSLSDNHFASFQNPATHFFLFVAQVVWPAFVPISIGLLEKNESRKKIFFVLSFIGISVSVWIAYCLINFSVLARIDQHHIAYQLDFPNSVHLVGGVSYFIATVFPAFFSTVKKMPLLGSSILLSYIITAIFFEQYLISVWCFFAAILSVVIYSITIDYKKSIILEPHLIIKP